jgi:hypothetical protein
VDLFNAKNAVFRYREATLLQKLCLDCLNMVFAENIFNKKIPHKKRF